ncbi:MAG TPA: MBL fold metallo-hydrolase [Paracoccus solventivorans]|uniref:MBL fold metallo-hydrolase n=1 Tax=Paracoccus solventivorans TaxID=53463 RepID=A0A832PMF1_9RHOB|nr:MBL fold metallo-hydrolase [Paracoccus solventivorans]HHW34373.1 MBL fold metallo-hydrolase [Paracoccus solventivorans]
MSDAAKVRVVLAPNPSAMTGPGTNSFLIGEREVAVIDPGPDDPAHIDAILELAEGRISHILVTHAHLDHSAGVARLAQATRAPVFAFGAADSGRSPTMARLAATGLTGGEGVDAGFRPDIELRHGEELRSSDWTLQALHTPGHMGGHLSFRLGDAIFCGDLVMGWSTSLISPPEGDLVDYFRSLDLLARLAPRVLYPAHGEPITAPLPRLEELAAHRRLRSAQILAALDAGPGTAAELAARIYTIPAHLMPAAERNVLAHLLALADLGAVAGEGPVRADLRWQRAGG